MKKLLLALLAMVTGVAVTEAREKSCHTCSTCERPQSYNETRTVKRPYTIQVCHDETRYEEVEQTRKVCPATKETVGEWSCGKKKCGQCHVCKKEKANNKEAKAEKSVKNAKSAK